MPTVRADDILLNGDFSDGKTHWHGDGDVPDLGGKLVITLKPDKWTVVYQDFSANVSTLKLKITYTYSDDCSLAHVDKDAPPLPPLTSNGLEKATGMANGIGTVNLYNNASWMVMLVSGGFERGRHLVYADATDSNPRTYTTNLTEWNQHFNRDDLCLAFPPGTGSVTITEVQMIPPATSAP